MVRNLSLLASICLVTSGCDGDFPRRLPLSTSPGEATAPPVVVQPQPRQFPPFEITTIAVGDVSSCTCLRGPFEVWAQTYLPGSPRSEGRLTATVQAGERYRIVLWYTLANLEYELGTTLQ
jgi:hypothetical protein